MILRLCNEVWVHKCGSFRVGIADLSSSGHYRSQLASVQSVLPEMESQLCIRAKGSNPAIQWKSWHKKQGLICFHSSFWSRYKCNSNLVPHGAHPWQIRCTCSGLPALIASADSALPLCEDNKKDGFTLSQPVSREEMYQ